MKKYLITFVLLSKKTRKRMGKSRTEIKEYPDHFTAANVMDAFQGGFVPGSLIQVVDVREADAETGRVAAPGDVQTVAKEKP